MFFTIKNKKYLSTNQLKADTVLNAYFIIKNYPLKASDKTIEQYIKQQYNSSLKDMCIKLLLNLTHYEDEAGNLILMFKDPRLDKIAQLITYGNGALPGSRILQIALKD